MIIFAKNDNQRSSLEHEKYYLKVIVPSSIMEILMITIILGLSHFKMSWEDNVSFVSL